MALFPENSLNNKNKRRFESTDEAGDRQQGAATLGNTAGLQPAMDADGECAASFHVRRREDPWIWYPQWGVGGVLGLNPWDTERRW